MTCGELWTAAGLEPLVKHLELSGVFKFRA